MDAKKTAAALSSDARKAFAKVYDGLTDVRRPTAALEELEKAGLVEVAAVSPKGTRYQMTRGRLSFCYDVAEALGLE